MGALRSPVKKGRTISVGDLALSLHAGGAIGLQDLQELDRLGAAQIDLEPGVLLPVGCAAEVVTIESRLLPFDPIYLVEAWLGSQRDTAGSHAPIFLPGLARPKQPANHKSHTPKETRRVESASAALGRLLSQLKALESPQALGRFGAALVSGGIPGFRGCGYHLGEPGGARPYLVAAKTYILVTPFLGASEMCSRLIVWHRAPLPTWGGKLG